MTRDEEKLGLNSSVTNDIVVEGAEVGPSGFCMPRARASRWRWPHSTAAGSASRPRLGIAQAAYEAARAYALERKQFGKRIAEFQAIQWKLADMATEIDAARMLVYRAAWLKEQGRPHAEEGAKAKLFASEMARRQTAEAIQIFGGYGYTKEFPGRAVLPGREDHGDLRRHERDPAARHRALDPGPQAARARRVRHQ